MILYWFFSADTILSGSSLPTGRQPSATDCHHCHCGSVIVFVDIPTTLQIILVQMLYELKLQLVRKTPETTDLLGAICLVVRCFICY
jgi:hypothetical protein